MNLVLSSDEALVLFEWLARLDEHESLPHEHQAEQYVLWSLHGQLEKTLVEPFEANYRELVEEARRRIASGWQAGR